jgi:hypothetical protein
MDTEKTRKVIYNPKNQQYYSLRQRSSPKGKKGTIMGVWRPERIIVLGRDLPRTRFLIQLLAMMGAVIIFAIAVIPLVVGSVWFPQAGASLLTGFGAGMIVILLPLIIADMQNASPEPPPIQFASIDDR